MQCPNCKQELMNINGRYICVECGTEVEENQVDTTPIVDPVATAVAQPEPDQVVPAETETSLSPEEPATDNSAEPKIEPENVPEVKNEEIPSLEFSTAENNQQESLVAVPEVNNTGEQTPSEQVVSELPLTQNATETVAPEIEQAQTEVAPTAPIADGAGDGLVEEENNPSSEPTQLPISEDSTPVSSGLKTENEEAESLQETASQQTPEGAPADPFEVVDSASTSAAQDPNLYQNPMYDQGVPEQSPAEPAAETQVPKVDYNNNGKILSLLIVGAVSLLLLTGGGVMAYLSLTKPVVIKDSELAAPLNNGQGDTSENSTE